MPSFVTEPEWQKAKKIVRAKYPEVDEKSDQFWKLVTTIYKSIAHYETKNESGENALLAAVEREDRKEFLDVLRCPISVSKNGEEYKVYSKKIDGSRWLIFSGSKEEYDQFYRAARDFAARLVKF